MSEFGVPSKANQVLLQGAPHEFEFAGGIGVVKVTVPLV
jgi:hypothetical protein